MSSGKITNKILGRTKPSIPAIINGLEITYYTMKVHNVRECFIGRNVRMFYWQKC